MKARLLITGATGFSGSYLIKALLKNHNYDVVIVKRKKSNTSNIRDALKQLRIYDINSSYNAIYTIIKKEKPDMVIHLAASYPRTEAKKDIELMLNSNIIFGTKLLNAMALNNVKRFLNTGSPLEYFNGPPVYDPATFYSATKKAFQDILEYYIKAHHFKTVTLLPYNTYGPYDNRNNLFSLIKNCILQQQKTYLTPGKQMIDLLYIEDLIDAYLKTIIYLLTKNTFEHEKFFVGSGQAVSLIDIVNLYKKFSGKNIPVVFGGIPYRKREVMFAQANIEEVAKKLKWKPIISLAEGIKRTLRKEQLIK